MPHEPEVGLDEDAARLDGAPAAPERVLADRVEDDVVRLAVLREVLLEVVDDLVGSERAHELDVLRVADGGDVGAGGFGQLYPCRPDRAGGAVDEDAPPFPEVRLAQAGPGDDHSVADRRGLLEAHARRLVRQCSLLADADVLGVRARADAEDLVSHLELGDGGAHGLDDAGQLHAADPVLRPAEAREEAREERVGRPVSAIGSRDRRGEDPDEDLALIRHGALDVLESLDLGRPVPVVHNRSHAFTSSRSFAVVAGAGAPVTVSTTFPVFWPVSTYLLASITSSSG